MLVLERLSDAQRCGHRVLAVVRGSAVNQDGASNGLTAPNGPSQERVIRQALAAAGLDGSDVDAVDAHGTGTALGDPIEAQALLATYGQERDPDRPLWLGSLKSNIGHTLAAAGVASVVKMVESMRHGVLPRTLHVDEPSPHVDWSSGAVELLTEARPWPQLSRPRRSAVSSFGISGTNAHVILEQAPDTDTANHTANHTANGTGEDGTVEPKSDVVAGPVLWPVSGKTLAAVRAQGARLASHLRGRGGVVDVAAVGQALATTRTHFDQRAAVVGDDLDELLAGLDALGGGEEHPALVTGSVVAGKTVFVFPGQGSQWAGMGRDLYATSPVFAHHLGQCAAALAAYTDWDLIDVLHQREGAPGLDRVDVIQPALWAMMVSLARLWQHHGIHPDAVIGHSQGEIAAAHIAGALTLKDAAAIVALRARTLRRLAGTGTMASLPVPADDARELIATHELDDVHIAAHNSPTTTVIAGNLDQVHALVQTCRAQNIRARAIDVDYASHTTHVEALRDELTSQLAHIIPRAGDPTIAFHSTLQGAHVPDTTTLTTDYWINNLRHPVLFHQTIHDLYVEGHTHYIEASPHPVLTIGLHNTLEPLDSGYTVIPTLRRGTVDTHTFATALATAHTHGLSPHWDPPATPVDLPTYPFQHQRYWLNSDSGGGVWDVRSLGQTPAGHSLLGAAVALAEGSTTVFTGRLSLVDQPWLADHAVSGTVLLPGTALVELALHAGHHLGSGYLEGFTLETPLTVAGEDGVRVQLSVSEPDDAGRRVVKLHSRVYDGEDAPGPWVRHATGTLIADPVGVGTIVVPETSAVWPPAGAQSLDLDGFYEGLSDIGYEYGPLFQGLEAAWRVGDDVYAEVALPKDTDVTGFGIHPALLDAALHTLAAASGAIGSEGATDGAELRLPFDFSGVCLHETGAVAARVIASPGTEGNVRLTLTNDSGKPLATIEAVTTRPVDDSQLASLRGESATHAPLLTVDWTALPGLGEAPSTAETWAVVGTGLDLPADVAVYPDLAALRTAIAGGTAVPDQIALIVSGLVSDPGIDPVPLAHTLTTSTLAFPSSFWQQTSSPTLT